MNLFVSQLNITLQLKTFDYTTFATLTGLLNIKEAEFKSLLSENTVLTKCDLLSFFQ